ncbi:MAG: hypothetical protein QGF68_17305, partial [Nitrospinota bacterium]|nr:hypothetical protein [Nitrospinota bacterium]
IKDEDDAEELEAFVKFTLDGSEIARIPSSINFQGKLSTRSIVVIQGLVVPAPGVLKASLQLDEREIGSWEVRIDRIGASQPSLIPDSSNS